MKERLQFQLAALPQAIGAPHTPRNIAGSALPARAQRREAFICIADRPNPLSTSRDSLRW